LWEYSSSHRFSLSTVMDFPDPWGPTRRRSRRSMLMAYPLKKAMMSEIWRSIP